jgi:hypothetical protein
MEQQGQVPIAPDSENRCLRGDLFLHCPMHKPVLADQIIQPNLFKFRYRLTSGNTSTSSFTFLGLEDLECILSRLRRPR